MDWNLNLPSPNKQKNEKEKISWNGKKKIPLSDVEVEEAA